MRNFLYRLYRTPLEVHHLLPVEKVKEFSIFTSSHTEVFLRKGVPSAIIEIALRHGCSPVNLLHIFGTPFRRSTSGWLLLHFVWQIRLRITAQSIIKNAGDEVLEILDFIKKANEYHYDHHVLLFCTNW